MSSRTGRPPTKVGRITRSGRFPSFGCAAIAEWQDSNLRTDQVTNWVMLSRIGHQQGRESFATQPAPFGLSGTFHSRRIPLVSRLQAGAESTKLKPCRKSRRSCGIDRDENQSRPGAPGLDRRSQPCPARIQTGFPKFCKPWVSLINHMPRRASRRPWSRGLSGGAAPPERPLGAR